MQINDSYITAAKNQLKEGVPITQTENAFSRNEGIFFFLYSAEKWNHKST